MTDGEHVPVLLEPAVDALVTRADGVYVDGTFGRGGHAREILARLSRRGRLVAIDRDPAAEPAARAIEDARFTFRHAWLSEVDVLLDGLGIGLVDGALLDLGISSPQIDDASRGFSFRHDGPLDMRMDPSRGEPAAAFLARASERELTGVLRDYGEERLAQPIAAAIVAARAREPIERTRQLAKLVGQAVGARTRGDWRQDPATRTFQALRIQVNAELTELSAALPALARRLAEGGRLAVISFHSLEDRIVKQFLARASKPFGGDARLARLPIRADALPPPPLCLVGRARKPDAAETARNPRARSAVLRVAERGGSPWPDALSNAGAASR
jgi:16S rRNA (cytosine1402-N4)-methyltransferase